MSASTWSSDPVNRRRTLTSVSRWIGEPSTLPCQAVQQTFGQGGVQDLLKDDRTTTVVVSSAKFEQHNQYVLKRYNARNLWHTLSRSVRKTRAQRCWQMSFAFANANINVAQPLFMLEQRALGFRGTAFFAALQVPGQELLGLFAHLSREEQGRVVEAVQNLFAALERHALSHGDMKASNLLWDSQRLWVIDLDAAQRHRSELSWRKANRKDRQRFLKNWHGQPDLLDQFCFLDY